MIELGHSSEIGRELKASELQPLTVVVVSKPDRPMVTLWVYLVGQQQVEFVSVPLGIKLIAQRRDEELYEDSQTRLYIYQYLGGDEPTSGQAQA